MSFRPSVTSDAEEKKKSQRAATLVLYAVLLALALWVIREFIAPLAWAVVIAIAIWPLATRMKLSHKRPMRTSLGALGLTLAVGLFVVLPFAFVLAQTLREAHELAEWIKTTEANGIALPDVVSHLPFGSQIGAWWQENLARPLQGSPAIHGLHDANVLTAGRHVGVVVARGLVHFGFMLLSLFLLLQAGPQLVEQLLKAVRRVFGADGAHLVLHMTSAVRGTMSGLVVVGLGEGVLIGAAYAFAGAAHVAILALLTAIAAMLPFCAPIVIAGVALWLFTQGATVGAAAVLAWGAIVVFAAEHFVRPLLIGSATRLPFLLVLFGILGGAETFGLIGLFIGPALMTIMSVLWREALH